MKSYINHLSPVRMLSFRAVKVFATLICAALFGSVLFATAVAVSNPVAGAIVVRNLPTIKVPSGGSNTFDFTDYIFDSEGGSISCIQWPTVNLSDSFENLGAQVTRSGCTYTYTMKANPPLATASQTGLTFRDSANNPTTVQVYVQPGPASSITYTAPTGLLTGPGHPIEINARSFASEADTSYKIFCSDATSIDSTGIDSVTRDDCTFTVTPKSVQGATTFTVPYTSSVSGSGSGVVSLQVGPASNIVYNAPTDLYVALNRTLTIDAAAYVSDGGYTVSCGDATGFNTAELASVTRGSGANSCMFTVTPSQFQPGGTTLPASRSFTVPYSSSGGDTHDGVINVMVNPSSTIAFTAPATNPSVAVGGSLTLDLGAYVSDGNYTVSCGAVTVSSAVLSLSSQNGCSVVLAAGSNTGPAAISVPYTSTGGATSSRTLLVDVIAASSITFDAPTGLVVGTNRVRVIDASEYVTETDDSYTISCGNAQSIDTVEIQSVTREGCIFTVTPKNVQGTASFVVPYTSSGGDTENGTISIEVGPPSTILFTDPDLFRATSPMSFMIDASGYVSENAAYTVTCGADVEFDSREVTSIDAGFGWELLLHCYSHGHYRGEPVLHHLYFHRGAFNHSASVYAGRYF